MTPEEANASSSGRRFHLLEVVGAGAFGEVYLAEQDSGAGFRRKVAIKLLHADVEKIQEAGSRMRDEARILARLSHRNIVTVLDLVRLGERWAVIMDYVPGADIEEIVHALEARGERVPVPAALEAGAAMLRALDAAYHATDDNGRELKVVHRDIKPSNVRLTNDGEIKVLDFGVARVELDGRESATRAEGWIGTELYMAPERILCEGDTPAGDVYAAMSTLFEMLAGETLGRTPVLENRHTPMIAGRLEVLAERLQDLTPELREELLEALRESLATEPEQRPDAALLADRLDVLARKLPGESLTVFARRVVPGLSNQLAANRQPASGVLSEVTGIVSSHMGASADSTVLPMVPSSNAPRKRRWPLLLAVGVATLGLTVGVGLVVIGGAAAALGQLGGELDDSFRGVEKKVAEVEAPAPAPAPVAEPAPVEVPELPPGPPPGLSPALAPRPAPSPIPNPDAPRVGKAQVAMADASSLKVACGDVSRTGTASVRITDFPAGTCLVEAVYLGQSYRHEVLIDRARGYTCTVAKGSLTCR